MIRRRTRSCGPGFALAGLLLGLLAAPVPAAEVAQTTLLHRWDLSPVYSSTYDVGRRDTSWWQKFALDRRGALADLKSALEIRSREDASRNDYQEADNKLSLQLARKISMGDLSLEGSSRRRWNQDSRSLTAVDDDHMNLGSSIGLMDRKASQLNLQLSGGWLRGRELKERQVGQLQTFDRTRTGGWEGEALLQGQWEPSSDLKLQSRASWDGSLQSSESQHVEEDETTIYSAHDHARTIDLSSSMEWSRHAAAKVALDAKYTTGFAQYYQATRQAQETKGRRSGSLEMHLAGDPIDSVGYAIDLTTDLRAFDYRVDPSDKSDSNRSGRYSAEYRPALPLLRGSRLRGAVELGKHRTENQNTPDYSTHSKSIEGQFERPFGPRFTLQLRGTESLTQDFYDDLSLDKDRLRSDTFFSLTYDRGQPFRALASYATSRTEDVNIPSDRAGQNQVQNDYRVTFDYTAGLPAGIGLRQNFQISATYTYFVFDETKNTLTRTNRVTTKVDLPLWPSSSLYLEHIYLRSDNGLYTYSGASGARGYGIGAENLRQNLSAVANYRLWDTVEMKATQSFNVETRQTADSTAPTRREKLTFSGLVALHRKVRGLDLDASFERTSSNTEVDYWTIDARLEKRFN